MIRKILRKCLHCGKEIKTYPSRIKQGRGRFCSHACNARFNHEGSLRSEDTKRKMRKSAMGKRLREKCGMWKGGVLKSHGRYFVLSPDHPNAQSNGYILRYRLIMSKTIGRPLTKSEVVHHIDGNKENDHPDNLMLFPSEGAHSKYHKRLQLAK